ncbi:hypothetical protein C8Q80DRAFT_873978 [Daedaleopsis nitida]|nr:hypothetical protein C8Q80DRAFT_873978 [Daedaleopsis nitida]
MSACAEPTDVVCSDELITSRSPDKCLTDILNASSHRSSPSIIVMPLFRSGSRNNGHASPPPPQTETHRNGGFFSRRSDSPEQYNGAESNRSSSTRSSGGGGFFSRRRSSSSSVDLKHDPSIVAARQKVGDAEAAEFAADRALNDARNAVRTAKNHVKILEQEALNECVLCLTFSPQTSLNVQLRARRAKMKQAEAKTIKKSTGRLGRHGN